VYNLIIKTKSIVHKSDIELVRVLSEIRKQKSQKLVYDTFIEKDAAWMMSAIIMEENVTQILSIINKDITQDR